MRTRCKLTKCGFQSAESDSTFVRFGSAGSGQEFGRFGPLKGFRKLLELHARNSDFQTRMHQANDLNLYDFTKKDGSMRKFSAITLCLFAALLMLGASSARAGDCTLTSTECPFSFSNNGNSGWGFLTVGPSGLADDSLLATSGTLNLVASSDNNLSTGTYSLIAVGPAVTLSPSGLFLVDNLVYPNDDAASGVYPAIPNNPSYLTNWGLLFGASGTEINIWGNGQSDYAFWSETGGGWGVTDGGGGTFSLSTPEPVSMVLFGTFLSLTGGVLSRKKRMA